jgi:hypothetical protein
MSAIRFQAIETKYAGVQFRSRLEAKWAAFFDLAGWEWEYEPFDLDGYIPDFLLTLHRQTLVEVKPMQWNDSVDDAVMSAEVRTKMILSQSWAGEFLLVGSRIPSGERFHRLGLIMSNETVEDASDWSPWHHALGFKCADCGLHSFLDESQSWHCRVCGAHDGPAHLEEWDADSMFKEAASKVQWRPKR